MPRNLTDLMEAAVSAAPPETHHAADITHLAERRQRRRTTFVAAGVALAVVAVAGVTAGVVHHSPTTPEPAAGYLHDQTIDASSAVPAASVPGYQLQPWTLPSVQDLGKDLAPVPTYSSVDADGRLVVQSYQLTGSEVSLNSTHVYDAPGQAPTRVPSPADGVWLPSFLDDGRLLWSRGSVQGISRPGAYVTDGQGGHPVLLNTDVTLDATSSAAVQDPMVSGDGFWFTVYEDNLPGLNGSRFSLYRSTFSGQATKVADDVAVAAVNDGTVAWVTTEGQVVTMSAAGGRQRTVPVPLSAGCYLPPLPEIEGTAGSPYLAVSSQVLALTERCGSAKNATDEMLAFDVGGHPLVHVTGAFGLSPVLGKDSLVFQTLSTPDPKTFWTLRYDFATGSLASLGSASDSQPIQDPQAAGRFVLWYDKDGGHVGEFTG